MPEIVYILTNPTMPDLIKIGKGENLDDRIKQLSAHTGVPVPFECYCCYEVEDSQDIEKALHFAFGDHRINPRREFFRMNPERAKVMLERLGIQEVTVSDDAIANREERASLNKEKSRRPVFIFSMVDIPIGSELTFLKDEEIVATVSGDREITHDGNAGSFQEITLGVLERLGYNWSSCRGPDWWLYEGESLTDRRLRMEESPD